MEDKILVFYEIKGESELLRKAVENNMAMITGTIKKPVVSVSER